MKEALGAKIEGGIEAAEMAEFIPEAVDRIQLPTGGLLTIVRGWVNGVPQALVFGADSPPELMLPEKEGGQVESGFQTIRDLVDAFRERFPRVAAGLGVGAGALAALQGCGDMTNQGPQYENGPDAIGGNYTTHGMALTTAAALNLGAPQNLPWTQLSDENPNISTINGKTVITFQRNNAGNEECWYVECNQFEQCLTQGVAKQLLGIPSGWGYCESAAIYEDANGTNKILLKTNSESGFTMSIGNNANGQLEASGQPTLVSPSINPSQAFSSMEINGAPHVFYDGANMNLRNLQTNANQIFPLTPDEKFYYNQSVDNCGAPHFQDGGVAIGSAFEQLGGSQACHLVVAPTLEGLFGQMMVFIDSQKPASPVADKIMSPRIHDNFVIYVAQTAQGTKMFYAVVQPFCQDGTCNGSETPQSCPADCPPVITPDAGPDTPDAGPDTPDAGPDTPDAGPDTPDAGPDTPDAGPDTPDAGPDTPDAGPDTPDAGPDIPDAGPDTPDAGPDTPDAGPDTTDAGPDITDAGQPDPCDFAKSHVNMIQNACDFENCEDPAVTLHGQCQFEVDLGGQNPVTIELDGKYSLDLLAKAGAFLGGKYKIVSGGNDLNTKYGLYGTAPAGTTFGGEGPEIAAGEEPAFYKVWCSEGKIEISYNGVPIATIEGDPTAESITFVDGVEQGGEDAGTTEPDAGEADSGSEPDASTTEPDAGTSADSGSPLDVGTPQADAGKPPKVESPGGCTCTVNGNPKTSGGQLALFVIALLALLRRKKKAA